MQLIRTMLVVVATATWLGACGGDSLPPVDTGTTDTVGKDGQTGDTSQSDTTADQGNTDTTADTGSSDTTADTGGGDTSADTVSTDGGNLDTSSDTGASPDVTTDLGVTPDGTVDGVVADGAPDTVAPDTSVDTVAPDTSVDTGPTPDTTVDTGPDTGVPSLTVAPASASTVVSGAAIKLTATLKNSTATINWTLSGPGSLSATTGVSINYTPPLKGPPGVATVTATAGALSDNSVIQVNQPPRRQIVAYAWASNPTTTSYPANATYSYNSTGGAITITRAGVGIYAVSFAGQSLGSGDVQVTAYNSNRRCSQWGWGGATVGVRCFNAAGGLSDSRFTVAVYKNDTFSTANVVAYAWANNATSASYTPSSGYAYNAAGGAITATRSGTGSYAMSFGGMNVNTGNVQVSAYQSNATCNVLNWGGSTINVRCYSAAGLLVDSRYTVSFARSGVNTRVNVVGYAWANAATSASYTPSTAYSYNSSGLALVATRSAAGTYAMRFTGLNISAGHVKVSSYATNRQCNVNNWTGDTVNVRCYDQNGNLADTRYTIVVSMDNYAPASSLVAYAWANNATSASYAPSATYSYNSTGGAITATRSGTGVYAMAFAGQTINSGDVQVSAYQSSAKCNVWSWGGTTVNVRCFNAAGGLVDSRYTVAVWLNNRVTRASEAAYAWTNNATSASYTPSGTYAYNASGGAITAARSAAGTYSVTFAGLAVGSGSVLVSAYQSNATCNVQAWGGNTVSVRCYNPAGALVDSRYVVRVLLNDIYSAAYNIAYAWASSATAASYTPSTTYSYNSSGGAITATRTAAGTYAMRFAGQNLGSGTVKVSTYNTNRQCNVNNWGGETVNVRCYDQNGNLADTRYVISFTRR